MLHHVEQSGVAVQVDARAKAGPEDAYSVPAGPGRGFRGTE
ncbi:MAG: hypothetical protein ACRD29_07120 [Acidimicrobiales bacterium]